MHSCGLPRQLTNSYNAVKFKEPGPRARLFRVWCPGGTYDRTHIVKVADHPFVRVAGWRYTVLGCVAVASAVVAGGRGDWNQFVDTGRVMLDSAGLHVYEIHHDVQAGPLALLLAWMLAHTPRDGFVMAAFITAAL